MEFDVLLSVFREEMLLLRREEDRRRRGRGGRLRTDRSQEHAGHRDGHERPRIAKYQTNVKC